MSTPDQDSFDISEWLSVGNAGRAQETITVYNDLSLFEQATDLAARIKEASQAEQEEDLALTEKSTISKLEKEQEELTEKINRSKAEVTVTSLSDQEVEDLTNEFKEAGGTEKELHGSVKGTCWTMSKAAKFNGQKLNADQWAQVADVIAGGQWQKVKQAWIKVQGAAPRVDIPFSQGTSKLSKAVRP